MAKIVYGPQGCGKTRNVKVLMQKLGCTRFVEDEGGDLPQLSDDVLVLTNRPIYATALDYFEVMAREGYFMQKQQSKPVTVHRFLALPALPQTGFVRLPQILAVFPVGRSTWWNGCKAGIYPQPVKISPRCTAWKAEDIRALIEKQAA